MSQRFNGLSFTYGVPEYGCNLFTRAMAENMAREMERTGIPSELLGGKHASFLRVQGIRFENWSADGSVGKVFIDAITKDGPVFLDDMASDKMRNAALDAKMAGFELAAHPPDPTQQDDGEEEQTDVKGAQPPTKGESGTATDHAGGGGKAATGPAGKGDASTAEKSSKPAERATDAEPAYIWRQGSCTCSKCTTNAGTVRYAGEAYPSGETDIGQHEGCDCKRMPYVQESQDTTVARLLAQVEALLTRLPKPETSTVPQPEVTEQDVIQELKRWRDKAVGDMKVGRAQRGFTTVIIPEPLHTRISTGLAVCTTVDEVKEVFNRVRDEERDTSFFLPVGVASNSGGNPQQSRSTLKPKW